MFIYNNSLVIPGTNRKTLTKTLVLNLHAEQHTKNF